MFYAAFTSRSRAAPQSSQVQPLIRRPAIPPPRRHTTALRTGLGSRTLRNFKTHAAAAQSRFPRQPGPQVRPPGIENALCHVGTSEFRWANIANGNEPKLHKLRRLLVEKIFSAISDLGVNSLNPLALSSSLGGRKLGLTGTAEHRHGVLGATGQRRQRLGSEVYTNPIVDGLRRLLDLDRHVDIPAPSRILRAGAAADLGASQQWAMQPNVIAFGAKDESAVAQLQGLVIKRHPAERTTGALRFAPTQPGLTVLFARGVVLLAKLLHNLRVQVETFLVTPRSFGRGRCS